MHGVIAYPSLGIYATAICPPSDSHHKRALRGRHGAKSAPANLRYRRRDRTSTAKSQNVHVNRSINNFYTTSTFSGIKSAKNSSSDGNHVGLSVDDVIDLAEQTREMASQENRRSVLEEAQKAIRHEVTLHNSSRPHSVIGVGLQALTSPMPLSARNSRTQMNHIPTLLALPSDRTFIPSPDYDNSRHVNTPVDDLDSGRCQSVARQCCEIMGRSMCNECRKLERRLLNREKAEKEYPRLRISERNITTTQIVKRLYPYLTDAEIQDKLSRGEIARVKFLSRMFYQSKDESDSELSDDENDNVERTKQNELTTASLTGISKKQTNGCSTVIHSDNPIFALSMLKRKLRGTTSTPLYFTDLKSIQAKILTGEVDRKKHLVKPPNGRLNSAVSTLSTTSSNKSSLSKKGLKLSESLMPVFVSPRKVQICREPSYKAYYEPPLLSKRRQIPNPSFFAGSSDAYSLPERLPDIIEFADSKIKALEKQGRSTSSMSFTSNFSEEGFDYEKNDPLSSSRKELDKSEKEGDVMLGESQSSSTPRMWLKSSEDVIDENFAGEEEYAREQDVTICVSEHTDKTLEVHHGGNDTEASDIEPNIETKDRHLISESSHDSTKQEGKKQTENSDINAEDSEYNNDNNNNMNNVHSLCNKRQASCHQNESMSGIIQSEAMTTEDGQDNEDEPIKSRSDPHQEEEMFGEEEKEENQDVDKDVMPEFKSKDKVVNGEKDNSPETNQDEYLSIEEDQGYQDVEEDSQTESHQSKEDRNGIDDDQYEVDAESVVQSEMNSNADSEVMNDEHHDGDSEIEIQLN